MNLTRDDELLSNGVDINCQIKKDRMNNNNNVIKHKQNDYEKNFSMMMKNKSNNVSQVYYFNIFIIYKE